MQSFQDFLQSRRKKSETDADEPQLLKRSRSSHASSPSHDLAGQLRRSFSNRAALSAGSPPHSYTAAGAAAAALAAHTTTTVSGAGVPSGGGRYASRSTSMAASSSSKNRRSEGLTAALQQLISPQRSSLTVSQSNSFRLSATAAASASSPAADQYAAAPAAAAGAGLGELLAASSSRSVGLGLGSNSLQRLQPLSVADALCSPRSRSTAATPPRAHTPTGQRTPGGGWRYPGSAPAAAGATAAATTAAAASGGGVGGHSPPAGTSGWVAEASATAVLQEAAARAAALNRSTSIKSSASQGGMLQAGLQATTHSGLQAAPQQDSQQLDEPHLQLDRQQQCSQEQQQQQLQQQRESAAALLQDLDRRFASIKDSLKGVYSPHGSMKQQQQQGPDAAAAVPSGVHNSQGSLQRTGYHNKMTEPYSLDDDSSSGNSSRSTSPTGVQECQPASLQRQQHRQPQQQQFLTPSDSCSDADTGSSEDEQPSSKRAAALQQRQQQQNSRHVGAASPQLHWHHQDHAAQGFAEATLSGGGVGFDRKSQHQQQQQRHGKPAAIAAAAAAAAAATAAAADGSLPIEVDVKCGEEGELQGATAHFIVSSVTQHALSPHAAAGALSSQQQQQQGGRHAQQHSRWQQQQQALAQEASVPSTSSMLYSQPSGSLQLSHPAPGGSLGRTEDSRLDIELSTDSLEPAGAPQPRRIKPRPSIAQKQQHHQQQQQQGLMGLQAGGSSKGQPALGAAGGAAAVVAAAGRGVLDGGEPWCSNALVLSKQQAVELQQQNDALVRVLERERQQHAKTRQQVSELQLDLQEAQAEWEVKLQSLRQEKAAAEAQLRRAVAGSDQQETFSAYDAALTASAARVKEAQAAAAKLASQAAELELQVSQLQLICSSSSLAARRPLSGASNGSSSYRADGVAVVRAVASAECRSPDKRSPCRNGFAPGAAADGCGGRGVRALRQHQERLEQQLARLSGELSELQRENVRLVRYKRQYDVAAHSLAASSGAKAAAEAFAEEAGLRAAAASGRADKLEVEVEDLQQQVQQLRTDRDRLQLQLDVVQQQQRLQASLSASASANSRSMLSGGPLGLCSPKFASCPGALAGVSSSAALQAALYSLGGSAAGTHEFKAGSSQPLPAAAVAAASEREQAGGAQLLPPQPAETAEQLTQQRGGDSSGGGSMHGTAPVPASPPAAAAAAAADAGACQPAADAADEEALYVVQQLSMALPDASPAQGQLASLMRAIQAGVQERQALAAQGKVLLDMLVGSS